MFVLLTSSYVGCPSLLVNQPTVHLLLHLKGETWGRRLLAALKQVPHASATHALSHTFHGSLVHIQHGAFNLDRHEK